MYNLWDISKKGGISIKKKKRILFTLTLLGILMSIFDIWFMNLDVLEGYVFEEEDSELYVIDLKESEANTMDKVELDKVLVERAANGSGNIVIIPFVNDFTGTNFQKTDRVKVYFNGIMTASIPGIIDGATLIVKTNK